MRLDVGRQKDGRELEVLLLGNLEEGQIEERVEGDDLYILDPPLLEVAGRSLVEDRGGDAGLLLNHVVVGHAVAPSVDDEPAAQARRRFDQHDALAELLRQLFDTPHRQAGGLIGVVRRRCGRGLHRIFAGGVATEDAVERDLQHVNADVDVQIAIGLLEDFAFDLLAGLEFDDFCRRGGVDK